MPLDSVGVMNQHWGVCGFTSTFYAMYALQGKGAVAGTNVATRVLAEVKSYLVTLQAEGKANIINEIETFTKTFGGKFASFTIADYIKRVNGAVSKTDSALRGDSGFGIAMPPDAVADYIKMIWGKQATVTKVDGGGDGVIGVTSKKKSMPLYDGLEHYMYRHSGRIYSWGANFGSIAEAAKKGAKSAPWEVCRLIKIG